MTMGSQARRFTGFDARTTARLLLAAWLILLATTAGPIATAFLVTPEDLESRRVVLSPPCEFKRVTGRECASCGMSRGFAALAHGRFREAYEYNRATPVLFVAFLVVAALSIKLALRAAADARAAALG